MRRLYSRHLALMTGFLAVTGGFVFALIQSPEILESPQLASVMVGAPLPHKVAGFEDCESCHGLRGMKPYPINHTGWRNESCTRCHGNPASP